VLGVIKEREREKKDNFMQKTKGNGPLGRTKRRIKDSTKIIYILVTVHLEGSSRPTYRTVDYPE